MKKKRDNEKFFLAVLLCGLFFMPLGLFAQEKTTVTISKKGVTLKEVIADLKEQTTYDFFYDSGLSALNETFDIDVKDKEVQAVLDEILPPLGLEYAVQRNLIIIREKLAQSVDEPMTIKGKVSDVRGSTMPGVTVLVKGTTIGTSTNVNGRFELSLPRQDKVDLVFSFIGMESQELAYTGQEELEVVMREDLVEMDEVVVTGYQTIDRRKNTSAVTSLSMDDIMIPGISSLDQMLEGQVPGMILMTNSGEVGVVPKIRIRGTSTLVGNREPLWVVDGIIVQDPVPISAEELNDPDYINRIGNAIAGLNPQDIERIDVLKDAAATALYGTKAANGVIVITTKKGRVGPPIINYNTTVTFRQRPRYSDRHIDLMNSKERIQFSRELADQHYSFNNSGMNWVGYEGALKDLYDGVINQSEFATRVADLETTNTDWFKLLTEDSFSHQHTLSVSGGSEDARYYASIGYTRDNDVIKGDYTQRYTTSINVESNLAEWLSAYFQLQGNVSEREYYQDELAPMDYAYNVSRAIPAYVNDYNYYFYDKTASSSTNERYKYNILNELENSYKWQNTSGITLNVNLKFNIKDWLNANAIVSYSHSNADIEGYYGEKTFYAAALRNSNFGEPAPSSSLLPYGGELTREENRNDSYTIRLQANLNKYFGEDEQYNINASAGFEMNSSHYYGLSNIVHRGYYLDRGKSFVTNVSVKDFEDYAAWATNNVPSVTDNLTNTMSGYATLTYSYKNLFSLNANARVDGSNKFGAQSNDKFLPIWSVSGNYNISEHTALQADWIDFISLKTSFGYQGNMLDDQTPVLLIQKLPLNAYYNENTASVAAYPNPNLKWEKTSSFNLGLNFSLFERKVQVETEYYYKRTKDAFMEKEVASMNGVSSYVINGGDIENQGYSVDVTVLPIKRDHLLWTISTSFFKDANKVNSNPDAQTYDYEDFLNGTVVVKGEPVNTFYSYDFIGLSPVDGGPLFNDMENQKHELFGLSKYDTFRRVLKVSGRREPYMSGNLSTTIHYKNFRVSAMFAYSLGAKTRLFRMFDDSVEPEFNVNREFMNRWKQPGDELHTNIPALLSHNTDVYSSYYKYYSTHYSSRYDDIQRFATNYYTMYDYSDIRVVSANYLKCNSLTFTYEFGKNILDKLGMSRLAITLSGTNLFTISSKELKGQTPTQGGFSEIQLSDRPTYSLGLNVSF